jgi:hypothetical protein
MPHGLLLWKRHRKPSENESERVRE